MKLRDTLIPTAIAAMAMLMTTGCDDEESGPDAFNGVFEVTNHTLSLNGCDTPQAVEAYDSFGHPYVVEGPFFSLKSESFFGQSVKTLEACDASDPCPIERGEDEFGFSETFFEKRGDAWVTVATAAGGSGTSCTVTQTESILEATETGMRVTRRIEQAFPEVADSDECLDFVDNPPTDQYECSSFEEVLAEPFAAE
ncbi:MAG: hypothetical protein ACE366_15370 [Bradymonadia bacterium]